jgi:hypothetical protein
MTLAQRWLDARYEAHVARRDGALPLLLALAEAREREAFEALAQEPGRHSLGGLFAIEVRPGPARRSA